MLLALSWNGIPIPNLPNGPRLWLGGFVVLAGVISWAWKHRSAAGDLLTKVRTSIAPKTVTAAGPDRDPVWAAIVTLGNAAKDSRRQDMEEAAIKAFEAFVRDPEVTP